MLNPAQIAELRRWMPGLSMDASSDLMEREYRRCNAVSTLQCPTTSCEKRLTKSGKVRGSQRYRCSKCNFSAVDSGMPAHRPIEREQVEAIDELELRRQLPRKKVRLVG